LSKVQLSGNASGTGIFTIASPNSNTDRTLSLPDATGTVQVSGNPISGTTGTFSGIIQANGGGVQFPATQVPSADANTLDDYEEGSWTPTLIGTGSNPTSTAVNVTGAYTKIGNQVTLRCSALWTWTGGSGSIRVGGIPFTASGVLSIGTLENGGVTMGGSYTWGGTLLGTGDTQVQLRKYSNAGSAEIDIALSNQTSGTWIRFTITYQV
jgi:hypothetical protein